MWPARWKLVSLWFSQTARVTADNALRFFVCLDYASHGDSHKNSAWYLVTAIYTMPAVLLAPFNGAICNTLPKRQVLIGSALFGFVVMGAFGLWQDHWLWCWGLIALGSAIYGPTRYAMLPAAAQDTHWPLTRINGFIEMGTFTAIIGGMILILGVDWNEVEAFGSWKAIGIIVLLNGAALAAAWPVWFPSDVRREEPAWAAVRDFFADCRRIWNEREARVCLIGLAAKRGLVIGMSGAMLALLFRGEGFDLAEMAAIAGWVAAGVAVGSLLAGLQKHPRRVLGWVPVGGVGFTLGMMYAAAVAIPAGADATPERWFCALVGLAAGLINVPLAATYQADVPADARGNAMAVRNMADYVCATVVGVGMTLLTHTIGLTPQAQLWIIAAISLAATLAAWWIFRREVWEQSIEFVFMVMYRFRFAGPGLDTFPLKGPVIVVANHSAWMDPLWLAKVIPRSLIPMMTSVFFDHWLLRFMMVYLADAIRVEASGFRRDIPELQKAIAALDAGKCLVIFPEGRLRRTEELPLKMFGQGVWHILKERPDTPVVLCWIEGGWGSFFSYFKGLPTKNKRFDIRRPLGIALGEPKPLDPEILADHRKTRQYLMEQCGQMRAFLGLEPVTLQPAEVEASEPEA